MKKILFCFTVCLYSIFAKAQDYDRFNAFMKKYSDTWTANRSFQGDNNQQIGIAIYGRTDHTPNNRNPKNYGFDDIGKKELEKEMNDYFMNH